MTPTTRDLIRDHAALYLAGGAAVSVMFSNAVCQILLGAAILVLLLQRQRWEIPAPLRWPLLLFIVTTLMSLALSPDPRAGLPQVKKFYVFMMLPVLYTVLRSAWDVRTIFLSQAAVASASGVWAAEQFFRRRGMALASGLDFYQFYVSRRATGFMGHWMTFSAEEMIAALLLGSLLLFGAVRERRLLWIGVLVLIGVGIGLGWTRSVWLGTALGACYLLAVRRPALLLTVPVVLGLVFVAAPSAMRERVTSLYRPHGQTDSNEHRRVTFYTGLEMVKAHPWFGLGPEMPGRLFSQYVPTWIPRPLPDGFYGHLHNVYLQIAAERGLFTFAVFVWLLGRALIDLVRGAARSTGLDKAILSGSAAALIGLLLEGCFEHNLGDSEVLTLFLILLACSYATLRAARHA